MTRQATAQVQQTPTNNPLSQGGLLQRKCSACGKHQAGGGTCTSCQNRAKLPSPLPLIQTKLTVGAPNDKYEQEADRVAEQIMRMPASQSDVAMRSQRPRIQRKCFKCDDEQRLQMKEAPGSTPEVTPAISSRIQSLQGSGQPLPSSARSFFEPRFGQDFSHIRVHNDAQTTRALSARAYTISNNIVFGSGQYSPETSSGRQLLAHELTHTVQQTGTLQRTPAAPTTNGNVAPLDPSKVNISVIPDVLALSIVTGKKIVPQIATVTFNDPAITHLNWVLYDPSDKLVDEFSTIAGRPNATTTPFIVQNTDSKRTQWTPVQGKYTLRCVGLSNANTPVAYADRSFYIWTSTPTANFAELTAEKAKLEAVTKAGSSKSFGEVGSSFSKLKDVSHDLAVLETGTGLYEGTKCSVKSPGATPTDCTNIVLEVLENTFAQQGRSADWKKVKAKYTKNVTARGDTKLSGLDIQAALQSEAGWKGIYWAPDPNHLIPKAELAKANSDEASYSAKIAKSRGTYMKDFGKKGYPGISINHMVTNYAPETPRAGYGDASKTVKDTTQLDKLKKLPFGVLAAHGGFHMTIITYGKVIEVHWNKEATSVDVIEQTDLEKWAVGTKSGYHYYASGAIVAPAADVDKAFK